MAKALLGFLGILLLVFLVWGGMQNDAARNEPAPPDATYSPENAPADR